MNDNRIEEQPYDDRHNTPPRTNPWKVDGDHIGNDHQATVDDSPGFVAEEVFGTAEPMPTRFPAGYVAPAPLRRPDPQGLQWHFGNGFAPLVGLASTDWASLRDLPNVELRTIHAHLMEAISQARAAMRERGMVVDF